jgi:gamma-glutamyltranspeptidase / glutathione hydrolase
MTDTTWIRNPGPKQPVTGLKAAVSTDNAIVTETMLQVMRDGGNAADAGVAGALVQAAVEPFMTNHTGTVTFLYYEAKTGKRYQLDSAGTMPGGLAPLRPIPPQGHGYGALPPSACIPGFMPGLKAIHERFATKPWKHLCEPAVRWADSGHPVSSFEYGVHIFSQDFVTYFPEGREFYMPGGYLTNVGETFRPSGMAETLRRVADEGPDWMITGGWADAFITKANDMGWKINKSHMTETPTRWLEPLAFKHHDFEVVSLAPPQMQGVFCAMVLGILRHLGIRNTQPGSAEHVFYMAHALRVASYHRMFFHDPEVADYGVESLLDDGFHAHLARLVRGMKPKIDLTQHVDLTAGPGAAGMMGSAGKPSLERTGANSFSKQPTGSCELSIVDAEGNWVQMMNTLQGGGIPGMVVGGVPMVGAHAVFTGLGGFIDAKVVKGTRVSSVIGNTMVFKGGKPVLSLGSPGNVHCTVPQVLTYALDFGLEPYAAADAPRMLPLAEDNSVTIEDRLTKDVIAQLKSWGTTVRATPVYDYHMGSFAMCFIDPATGQLGTTADPRRCGVAAGLPL